MTSAKNHVAIGKCLDRLAEIYEKSNLTALSDLRKNRFDYFIDLDVSKVDAEALLKADENDFLHDMIGIFSGIERNPDDPESSSLRMFVPRVGFLKS